jgi:hypothetical protein
MARSRAIQTLGIASIKEKLSILEKATIDPTITEISKTGDISNLGSITKPSQVSFLARRRVYPAGYSHDHTGDADPFQWDEVSRNIGNAFILSSGKLKIPITGWYHISFQIGARASGGAPVNIFDITLIAPYAGSLVTRLNNSGGLDNPCLFSSIVPAIKGESLYIKIDVAGSGTWIDCADVAGWFSGTLIN